MKERPILFSKEMVLAIFDGRKTKTRRVAKLNHAGRVKAPGRAANWHVDDPDAVQACPYGQPGDRLWVRETWRPFVVGHRYAQTVDIEYRANGEKKIHHPISSEILEKWEGGYSDCHWQPSIFMPRWASRILLEVTSVKLERVQDITPVDAASEGVDWKTCPSFQTASQLRHSIAGHGCASTIDYVGGFRILWDSINAKRGYGWDANPWVWAVGFKIILPQEAQQ